MGGRRLRLAIVAQPWGSVVPVGGKGSVGIWIAEVAQRIARNCRVLVCCPRYRGQKPDECCQGVRYRRFRVGLDRRMSRLAGRLSFDPRRPLFALPLYYATYAIQVAAAVRAARCDAAHIHNFSQFIPIIRAFNPRIRIALHMHCEWLTQLDRDLMVRRLRHADLIVGCSHYITDGIRRRFPEFADRCRTIVNGVSEDRFRPPEGATGDGAARSDHSCLFVGRISPEKGVHLLLDAFEEVIRRRPTARLELVGDTGQCPRSFIVDICDDERVAALARFYDDKGYWARLAERMAQPPLRGRVTWCRPMPQEELAEHYRRASVLVSPSLYEAFGMPLVEAMAAGIPVVASRVGGMTEIVEDGRTGRLVPANDPGALAEAICDALADPEARRSMGRAGRRKVLETFTWDRVAQGLLDMYDANG